MPIGTLVETVRKKADQCRGLKLTKLNVVRKLLGKMAALNEHKQFVMAVASGRVERVAQLVQACLNNGVGIRGLVERYERACREVYNPKGFTEDDIIERLRHLVAPGGSTANALLHRAKGLPGITTLRSNTVIRPLRASVESLPQVEEIEENIEGCTQGEPESTGPPVILHRGLMLDEMATEKPPRWDDKTNNILVACRESVGWPCFPDLEVFFKSLENGNIHLASEAAVAAFGVFSKDPRVYSARPYREGPAHAKFIQQIMTAGNNKRSRGNITYRTICIVSDGEAKRGAALVEVTMNRDLDQESPIHPLLSPLQLMNLRVGEDDVTADKDYQHGVKQHLYAAGHSQAKDAIPPPDSDPAFLSYHLLIPYVRIDLSLHQQLVHLSAAAHILFVLYSDEDAGTSFMANQTYNTFFCVAKVKVDIPDGEFFLILLGTDRLEVLFGLIRMAIGTDLCTRAIILASRPHWDRSPRRLRL
ncbi:hypothetical protein K438DRAFT_2071565 [Mycena galopus ATCC 62051]|nr:hypothetical protein K438DRAFT_2071565 [Mycena galopus ATCC 62051]